MISRCLAAVKYIPIVRRLTRWILWQRAAGGFFPRPEEVVELLLNNGADVDAPGGDYGNALQAAFYRLREDC